MASKYLAVLTSDNHIHLFTESNAWPDWQSSDRRHYCVPISTIFGSQFSHNQFAKDD